MRNAFLPPPRLLSNQPSAPSSLQIQSPVPSNAVRTHAVTQKPTSPTTTPPHLHPLPLHQPDDRKSQVDRTESNNEARLAGAQGPFDKLFRKRRNYQTLAFPSLSLSLSLSLLHQPIFEDLPAEAPRPSFFFSSTTRRPTLALTTRCFLNAHSYRYNYNNILPAACLRV